MPVTCSYAVCDLENKVKLSTYKVSCSATQYIADEDGSPEPEPASTFSTRYRLKRELQELPAGHV